MAMLPGLEGKVALVTGAGSGIGAAVAARLCAEGTSVILADIRHRDAAATEATLGAFATAVELDVRSGVEWSRAVSDVEERHGRLDYLVNCAGIVRMAPLTELTEQEYRDQVDINQTGTFLAMNHCAPLIAKGGGGVILNTSSINSLRGYPDSIGYAASKAAVLGMTKCAAHDLAASKIRVNVVLPGIIDTPMQAVGTPETEALTAEILRLPGRMGTPDEVADLALFLLCDMSRYVTGAEVLIDGGVSLGGA
jgi:NAD(P)-dependent dehydrogenase (short-subunit alcohol dehydrogenase family)